MIKSMTGYGAAELADEHIKIGVEIKTVNHRYCDIMLKMPRSLNALEDRIRRLLQQHITRGRVDVYIKIEPQGQNMPRVKINQALAVSYWQEAKKLQDALALTEAITITDLLRLSDVVTMEEPRHDVTTWWPVLENALTQALTALVTMRAREGQLLVQDMEKRAQTIAEIAGQIERRSPLVVDEYRERLTSRVQELISQGPLDPGRLETEVVLMAERSNITEEIVRLQSHLQQLKTCLGDTATVGRKLDFLLQEMNREINTVAAKSSDLAINHAAVEIKSELEKIREQVQNIE